MCMRTRATERVTLNWRIRRRLYRITTLAIELGYIKERYEET